MIAIMVNRYIVIGMMIFMNSENNDNKSKLDWTDILGLSWMLTGE